MMRAATINKAKNELELVEEAFDDVFEDEALEEDAAEDVEDDALVLSKEEPGLEPSTVKKASG